jgi:hypothetical protein
MLVDELLVELGGEPVRSIYGVGTVPELIGGPWHRYRRAVFEHPCPTPSRATSGTSPRGSGSGA